MGSKLHSQTRTQIPRISSRRIDVTNWQSMSSPLARQRFEESNKENIQEYKRILDLNKRIKEESANLKEVDIEDYRSKYEGLDKDIQPYFENPDEVESTKEYKEYISQKRKYESEQRAYQSALKKYNDYNVGYKMGLNDRFPWFCNKATKQGWRDGRDAIKNYGLRKQYLKDKSEYEKALKDYNIAKNTALFQNALGYTKLPTYKAPEFRGFSGMIPPVSASVIKDYKIPEKPSIPELYTGTKNLFLPPIKTNIRDYGKSSSYNITSPKPTPPKTISLLRSDSLGSYGNTFNLGKYGESNRNISYGNINLDNIQKEKEKAWYIPTKERIGSLGKGVWDYSGGFVIDALKGIPKTALYTLDTATDISNTIFNTPEYKKFSERFIPDNIKKNLNYNYDKKMYLDPEVQKLYLAAIMTKLGVSAPKVASIIGKGIQGYAGYRFVKEPSYRTAGQLMALTIIPAVIKQGMKSHKVRVGYNKAIKDLELQFGKNSKEIINFKAMWKRGFEELPRQTTPTKEWSARDVKAVDRLVKLKGKKVYNIVDSAIRKEKLKIIGSSVIKPQTTLKKPPRTAVGDVDVEMALKGSADRIAMDLRASGLSAKSGFSKTPSGTGYYVNLDGKRLINIEPSSYYYGQIKPLIKWYEPVRYKAWTKDVHGIKMASIRDQMRVKLWKGFVEKTRPKDIIDAQGIYKGTNYLFKDSNYKDGLSLKSIAKLFKGKIPIKGYSLSETPKEYTLPTYSKGITSDYYVTPNKYTKLYTPYKPNVPYTPYTPYTPTPYTPTPYTPYTPTPYTPTPYTPYTPYTPTPYTPKTPIITLPRKDFKRQVAFQPVYYTEKGKEILGRYFPNEKEASAEGFEIVDKSPLNKFRIKKVITNQLLSRHFGTKSGRKFYKNRNLFIERRPYRKDTRGETGGSFNIFPYVFPSHTH